MHYTKLDEMLIAIASGTPVCLSDITALDVDINAVGDNVRRTFLMAAAYAGRVDLIAELVEVGANVNLRCVYTAMEEAAMLGQTRAVKVLHELGVDINSRSSHGITPLMYASTMGQCEVVKLLLALGANVHHCDHYGMTALDKAEEKEQVAVVAILTDAIGFADVCCLWES